MSRHLMEHALQKIIASKSSEELLLSSLKLIHSLFAPNHCFVADVNNQEQFAYTQCYLNEGKLGDNFAYDLSDTPCFLALRSENSFCFHSSDVQRTYPKDQALVDLGADAYFGLPLTARNGKRVGLLVMLFDEVQGDVNFDTDWMNYLGYILGQELYQKKINSENELLVRQFHNVESLTNLGFFVWDVRTRSFEFSPNLWAVLEATPENDLTLESLLTKYLFSSESQYVEFVSALYANNKHQTLMFIDKCESPIGKDIKLTCNNVSDAKGNLTHIEGIVQNVTDQTTLVQEHTILNQALKQSNEAIVVTDRSNTIIQVNSKLKELSGYSESDLLGQKPSIFSAGLQSRDFYNKMWRSLKKEGRWEGELWNKNKRGATYPERLSISTLKDDNGQVTHYIGVYGDIARRMTSFDSNSDDGVKLLERQDFIRSVERDRAQDICVSVALFDIKGFSYINQTYGDQIGDQVLAIAIKRIEDSLCEDCFACRYGSDEFAVAYRHENSDDVAQFFQHIREALSLSYVITNRVLTVDWSTGVSSVQVCSENTNVLMQAKLALEKSKLNEGRTVVFSSGLASQVARRLTLKSALIEAINSNALEVHYQPIYDTKMDRATKFEALTRWKLDDEYVPPVEFISVAEEYDLIESLGLCVLKQACVDLKTLYNQGHTDIVFSINRSIKELSIRELQKSSVETQLKKHSLPTSSIVIEITESIALDENPVAKQVLDKLKKNGVKLAIDDFGTGYASFGNLISQDLDYLKIDRSFIQNLPQDRSSLILTETAINLANKLELDVIAEGVETKEQLDLLISFGCQFVQGYFLGKPAPFKDIYHHIT